ncbi:hypothetical protein MIMGU_mgv1a018126mg, partial [Erythranthe guttata]
ITAMETREAPPSHLLVKIEYFSLLGTCGIDEYETRYVSVSLAMADTSSLPANWEVNVVFNIFLYNQISGNYLSSPGRTRCFLETKSEWGISKFISKKILLDPSNGYLVNDNIVFGAEHDFKISDFSKLNERCFSKQFIAGGQKWKIILEPKGSGTGTDNHVSIFLNHLATSYWFSASINSWGWPACIELATINDPNKGLIVNDCCLLSIDIHTYLGSRSLQWD